MLLCKTNDIMNNINKIIVYVEEVIGVDINIQLLDKAIVNRFPVYISGMYKLYKADIEGKGCILVQQKEPEDISIVQFQKQFAQIQKIVDLPVVAVFDKLEAYNRKRLIQKKLAFIVPDKQLYIPWFYMDIRDYGISEKAKPERLNPVAQQILLIYILDEHNTHKLTELTFKKLAKLLDANPMGVTRAVDNLKNHGLVRVEGTKEKQINFNYNRKEIWNYAMDKDLFLVPVTKRVYVDKLPEGLNLLHSYDSALEDYTNMNPPMIEYFAIDKNTYSYLKKNDLLINENKYEGKYCLEIWKYNPVNITRFLINSKYNIVDPLSLYLCYTDNTDERVEMAKEQLIEKITW